MELYTCSCGNQTWQVGENGVRCTSCNAVFNAQFTPVREFNEMVTKGVREAEEAA